MVSYHSIRESTIGIGRRFRSSRFFFLSSIVEIELWWCVQVQVQHARITENSCTGRTQYMVRVHSPLSRVVTL